MKYADFHIDYFWFVIFILFVIILQRIIKDQGIGVRVIQLVAVILIISSVLILGLEEKLTGETLSALLGGMIGYLFGNIPEFDNKKSCKCKCNPNKKNKEK